jgi:hypothetical protein
MSKLEHYLLNLTLHVHQDVALRLIGLLRHSFRLRLLFTRMDACESIWLPYSTGWEMRENSSFTQIGAESSGGQWVD